MFRAKAISLGLHTSVPWRPWIPPCECRSEPPDAAMLFLYGTAVNIHINMTRCQKFPGFCARTRQNPKRLGAIKHQKAKIEHCVALSWGRSKRKMWHTGLLVALKGCARFLPAPKQDREADQRRRGGSSGSIGGISLADSKRAPGNPRSCGNKERGRTGPAGTVPAGRVSRRSLPCRAALLPWCSRRSPPRPP